MCNREKDLLEMINKTYFKSIGIDNDKQNEAIDFKREFFLSGNKKFFTEELLDDLMNFS